MPSISGSIKKWAAKRLKAIEKREERKEREEERKGEERRGREEEDEDENEDENEDDNEDEDEDDEEGEDEEADEDEDDEDDQDHERDVKIFRYPKEFFRFGRVFLAMSTIIVKKNTGVISPEEQWFIVIDPSSEYCTCLAIETSSVKEVARVLRGRYLAVDMGQLKPNPKDGEDRKRESLRRIQVNLSDTSVGVPRARLDFGKIYKVEYNVLITHHGMIAPKSEYQVKHKSRRSRRLEHAIMIRSLNAEAFPQQSPDGHQVIGDEQQSQHPHLSYDQAEQTSLSHSQSLSKFSSGRIVFVDSECRERSLEAKFDSGSTDNVISRKLLSKLGKRPKRLRSPRKFRLTNNALHTADRICFLDWWPRGWDTVNRGPCRSEFLVLESTLDRPIIGEVDLFRFRIYTRNEELCVYEGIPVPTLSPEETAEADERARQAEIASQQEYQESLMQYTNIYQAQNPTPAGTHQTGTQT